MEKGEEEMTDNSFMIGNTSSVCQFERTRLMRGVNGNMYNCD
jgi:hypothetical protein